MRNYIHLMQTTPYLEPCSQVGSDDYLRNAKIEALVYIDQLKRTFAPSPTGSLFKLVRCSHEFGTYLDIRFLYDDEDQSHVKYATDIELGCEWWDEKAIQELKVLGYETHGETSKSGEMERR